MAGLKWLTIRAKCKHLWQDLCYHKRNKSWVCEKDGCPRLAARAGKGSR